ncbi:MULTISPECIES: general stress protein [Fictibacillus]|uniref:General stress protein n=1 Tax=Fictibacillus enclensis TaxID=1017270 RepID=A0A0V8J3Z0_9BACL|nr:MULTISPECIES: general stress protein [Fictibacillus]KSU81772.1 general stress protein [Fictibacillus enclensis]RXZ01200.1 general stress protein [Fictibacillus sp. S7]SCC25861.1 Heat induced stress protein YflT [Fictibacillus enclensis]
MAKPLVREFTTDQEVITAVQELETRGIDQEDVYVLAHEKDDTRAIADAADANTIGTPEQGLGTAIKNVFRKRGDELRSKLEEIGLSSLEADEYEKKLDQGKVLVLVKGENNLDTWV